MTSKSGQLRALRERKFEAAKPKPEKLAIANAIINSVNKPPKSNATYQSKWRAANPELNRQRARDGMKKRRAEKAK